MLRNHTGKLQTTVEHQHIVRLHWCTTSVVPGGLQCIGSESPGVNLGFVTIQISRLATHKRGAKRLLIPHKTFRVEQSSCFLAVVRS